MIAERQVQLGHGATGARPARSSLAAYPARPSRRPARLLRAATPRAHRAAALAQIGRLDEARQELRAGLALARTGDEREALDGADRRRSAPSAGPGAAASRST